MRPMRRHLCILALLIGQSAFAAPDYIASAVCGAKSSTPEMNACAQKDFDAADRVLNAEYAKTRARLSPAAKASLLAQQRAWLKALHPGCRKELESEEGGTIWTSMYTSCLTAATRLRTRELRAGR